MMQDWSSDVWQEELEGYLSGFQSDFPPPFTELTTDCPSAGNEDQQQQQQQDEVQGHSTSAPFASRNGSSAFQNWRYSHLLPSVACSSSAAAMRRWILEHQKAEYGKNKMSRVKQEVTTEEQQLPSSPAKVAEVQIQTSSYNHKMAERQRRKMEAEHLSILKTYIPANKKKDKVSTLKGCVHYIQELVATVNSLKKEGAVTTIPDCIQFIQDLVHRVDSLEKQLNSTDEEVTKSPDQLSILTQEQEDPEESSSTRTS